MFSHLDRQTTLTGHQRRIIAAAMLGDMLEFFDYFLIGFVMAFIVGPWQLTFGRTAVILLSSGFGAIFGALFYGWLADRIGRRIVFMLTVINFSVATGALAFTPDGAWIYLSVFRFVIGFGVGGLYCVDLPLVQEFVPASKRGMVGGLVTSTIPLGILLGSLLGATLTPYVGWRGLFAIGAVPGLLTLLVRAWVPESPRWLTRVGRSEDARRSLAWALEVPPESLPLPKTAERASGGNAGERGSEETASGFRALLRYPRSLMVSWISNLGAQTGYYGLHLWAPTLLALLLGVKPERAAFLMIFVNLAGFFGRMVMSYLSDRIGRRPSGTLFGFGAAAMLVCAAIFHDRFIGTVSVFWLLLIATNFIADGGFAIVGPYSAEVWPSSLRTTGMGSAYGFGGLGKVIGPLGLALLVGASNVITPQASIAAIRPAYFYLAGWFALAGVAFLLLGIETRGRSIETLDAELSQRR